ncbi:MAG: hypothetical protein CVU05_05145 [Bacteroidetes bacterium HGW-Bacteroidetes-21]|jgi:dTDP-4-amino-4,6-dideoxy-D-galactose acyltransferase|nr:MAG: hypothetical protein CVU05_05145 [Bacteroidetes bacterium HGW-Bacteroidetes-21]
MANGFQILDYDSNLFGYKTAMLSPNIDIDFLPDIIKELKKENVRLAYWAADNLKIMPPQKNVEKIFFAGTKITYFKPISEPFICTNKFIVEYPQSMPSEKLISLAIQSGIHSRFNTDPLFKSQEFEKLYNEWIEKSTRHILADYVIVYKNKSSEISGMVTIKINNKESTIGLIAVDEKARGGNIGSILLQKTEEIAYKSKCKKIYVATQKDNIGACKFYEKNGYTIYKSEYFYHFWI